MSVRCECGGGHEPWQHRDVDATDLARRVVAYYGEARGGTTCTLAQAVLDLSDYAEVVRHEAVKADRYRAALERIAEQAEAGGVDEEELRQALGRVETIARTALEEQPSEYPKWFSDYVQQVEEQGKRVGSTTVVPDSWPQWGEKKGEKDA